MTPASIPADVVVLGAGFAGLSAAVRLAEAGRRVVVVEAAPRLGGRASTFGDPVTGERIDNGQHVLFGCYRETYAFLRRLGTDKLAPLDRALNVSMANVDGRQGTLSCPPLPSPWHLLAGVLRWDAIPIRDRLTVLRLAPELRRLRRASSSSSAPPSAPSSAPPSAPLSAPLSAPSSAPSSAPLSAPLSAPASETVSAWLRAHGQSPELCRWLWHPLAIAALNQSADDASAGPFLRVIAGLFGPRPDDSAVGLPAVPLDELYALPAARLIEARGGAVLTKVPGRVALDPAGAIVAVRAGTTSIDTRSVISAVPWHAQPEIWESGCPSPLAGLSAAASRMTPSPIVTVNLWFDRPVMRQPFVGLIGSTMHWAFDKRTIVGGSAGHISVVSSGAVGLARMENEQIVNIALGDLGAALPGVRAARVCRSLVVRERRATFSLAPGEPARPGTITPLPGFFLAGDWVDTGLPATIESAVQSGHAAADAALAGAR